MLLTMHEG